MGIALRYALAVVTVTVVTLVRFPIQPFLGDTVPYLLYYPTVAATAWWAGFGPGVFATLLSAVAALIWFIPDHWNAISVTLPQVLFIAMGAFIAGVTGALRRAERRADAERSTLAATLLSIGDGVIVTDLDARISMMNRVAEQLTGWSSSDARGRPVQEIFRIVDERSRLPVDDPIGRVLGNRAAVSLTNHTVLIARTGAECPIDESAAPIHRTEGALTGAVLVFRQVAERRRVEAEREAALLRERQARVEAESASRLKDEFLATLSHELRTPLNAILGWARMLRDGSLRDGRREHALAVIQRNAEAQRGLIEELLDMSRFMTGKIHMSFDPVHLPDVVSEAVDAVRLGAEAKALTIRVQTDHSVPPIAGDRNRLRQLVWNLMSNAVKFTGGGGRILVTVTRADHHLLLRLTDTGPGARRARRHLLGRRFCLGRSPRRDDNARAIAAASPLRARASSEVGSG